MNKKLAVYEGLLSLLEEGYNPYLITVSEIAKAANIGKGTIYDYFGSKEETITKALIYNMTQELSELNSELGKRTSFDQMIRYIFSFTKDKMSSQYSCLSLLSAIRNTQDMYSFMSESDADVERIRIDIEATMTIIINQGFLEGVISKDHSIYYIETALRSVILGYQSFLKKKNHYKNIDIDTATYVSIEQLNKLLGGK